MSKKDPIKDLLPLSKLPPGTLNQLIRNEAYESFSTPEDNFIDLYVKMARKALSPNYSLVNRTFNGVCLYVLDAEETQRLISHNDYKKLADIAGRSKIKACRVYIPEIHTDRCLPNNIYSPTAKDKEIMKAFFPIFVSKTEDIAERDINEGDIVEVKIKNNLGGGVYIQKINGKSTVSVFKKTGGSNASFKCSIVRFQRIEDQKGRTISAGTVISSPQKSAASLTDAALKQQYIKFLYAKERFYNKKLRAYWSKGAYKKAIQDAINQLGGTKLSAPLIWGLVFRLSGYGVTGLANKGRIAMPIGSLDDSYGVFKTTKAQYDLLLKQNDSDAGLDGSLKLEFQDKNHSDLLDPAYAIKFFIIDFRRYLTKNNVQDSTWGQLHTENNLTASNKKTITKYFSSDEKKIEFFFKDFADIYPYNSVAASTSNHPIIGPDASPPFPTFDEWLAAALGGVALNIQSAEKTEQGPPENSPNLGASTPAGTKDECHNNYPLKNPYLVHVDSQKKIIKEFIESRSISDSLKYTSNKHVGQSNIIINGEKIKTNFKVLRFDGITATADVPNRWTPVDAPGWGDSMIRSSKGITHFIIHSLNGVNDHLRYYKDTLRFMQHTGKTKPHFLVSPTGQIIQLVDVGRPSGFFDIPSRKFSVNAAFVEGVGDKGFLRSDDNNVAIRGHVLIKNKKDENVYRPHKIGTSAALESMQKLILFFIQNNKYKI